MERRLERHVLKGRLDELLRRRNEVGEEVRVVLDKVRSRKAEARVRGGAGERQCAHDRASH